MNTQEELDYINRQEGIWKKVENPHLDLEKEIREQLVSCLCGISYRIDVNGSYPISDTEMKDVFCPYCKTPAKEYVVLSGHSAGWFNASLFRLTKK